MSGRLCARAAALLAVVLVASAFPYRSIRADAPAEQPGVRLVVIVVVDQLRRDRLDPHLPGGLGRLVRKGRVFTEGAIDHAVTATCPGHMSIVSGRHPGPAGVPGNSFTDHATGRRVYCVEDARAEAAVFGTDAAVPENGRSPSLLRAPALGDWMKAANPESRVVAVSGKDRAAITLGGQHPDAVYWLHRGTGFTTSRYYASEMPATLLEFNQSLAARVPAIWEHAPAGVNGRVDDYPHESPDRSRASPHPIHDNDPKTFHGNLYFSPFVDTVTLELALQAVERFELGSDDVPDLLLLGLSATDLIGHAYGPESAEAIDGLARLDADFGVFWKALEERVGARRIAMALSSDHGVLPVPEWLAETGRSTCPVEGGRAGVKTLAIGLGFELHTRFAGLLSVPGEWAHLTGAGVTVDRQLAAKHGVKVADVAKATQAYLEENEAIEKAWTADELAASDDDVARLYRNSWSPERGADLLIQLVPTCLVTPFDRGTTHGTPHGYDRDVPIVIYGPGVDPGPAAGRARTIDIAPTLAKQIGLPLPPGLDGEPLF